MKAPFRHLILTGGTGHSRATRGGTGDGGDGEVVVWW